MCLCAGVLLKGYRHCQIKIHASHLCQCWFFVITSLCHFWVCNCHLKSYFLPPSPLPTHSYTLIYTKTHRVPGCSGDRGRPGYEGRAGRSRALWFSQCAERWGRHHLHHWPCTSCSSHTAPAGPQQQLPVEALKLQSWKSPGRTTAIVLKVHRRYAHKKIIQHENPAKRDQNWYTDITQPLFFRKNGESWWKLVQSMCFFQPSHLRVPGSDPWGCTAHCCLSWYYHQTAAK